MGLIQSSAPETEPVTLAQAKEHLSLATSAQDDLVTGLIKVARKHCEELTDHQFITATWDWTLQSFPGPWGFTVPWPPLQSVTHIKYIDVDGDLQTLSTDVYQLDIFSRPGSIVLKHNQSWPQIRHDLNAVQIQFVAGYGNAASDLDVRLPLLVNRLVAYLFKHRGVIDDQGRVAQTPAGFEQMLAPFTLPDIAGMEQT